MLVGLGAWVWNAGIGAGLEGAPVWNNLVQAELIGPYHLKYMMLKQSAQKEHKREHGNLN